MQNKTFRVVFDEGAGGELPPVPVEVSDREVADQMELERRAPTAARLLTQKLYDSGYVSVSSFASTREAIEKAYANPRALTVTCPGTGRALQLSELEVMLRNLTNAWPERPLPEPVDPLAGPESGQEHRAIEALIAAARDDREWPRGDLTAEERARFLREWRRSNRQGNLERADTIAKRAGLAGF